MSDTTEKKRGRPRKYPFHEMKSGESIVVPYSGRVTAQYHAERYGLDLKMESLGGGQYRITKR